MDSDDLINDGLQYWIATMDCDNSVVTAVLGVYLIIQSIRNDPSTCVRKQLLSRKIKIRSHCFS